MPTSFEKKETKEGRKKEREREKAPLSLETTTSYLRYTADRIETPVKMTVNATWKYLF